MTVQFPASLPNIPNPYLNLLGARLLALRQGYAEFVLDIKAHHLNKHHMLHGGAIASLLDVSCGYAGLIDDDGSMVDAITLSLTVTYLSAVNKGRLRAVGEITGGGRNIYFADASIFTQDGKLVARATGTFKRSRSAGTQALNKSTGVSD